MVAGTLLLSMDGVTEATAPKHRMLESQWLLLRIDSYRDKPADKLVADVMDNVSAFAYKELQAEDITIMAIRYQGTTAAVQQGAVLRQEARRESPCPAGRPDA